jgi:hypothetical protein
MTHNPRTRRIGLALAGVLASGIAVMTPAAAEPYPWHRQGTAESIPESRPSKAQIEHRERLAAAAATPTKAQIEHRERLAAAAATPTKAQIEHRERLAAAAAAAAPQPESGQAQRPAGLPWAALGFVVLGVLAWLLGITAIRSIATPRPIR